MKAISSGNRSGFHFTLTGFPEAVLRSPLTTGAISDHQSIHIIMNNLIDIVIKNRGLSILFSLSLWSLEGFAGEFLTANDLQKIYYN